MQKLKIIKNRSRSSINPQSYFDGETFIPLRLAKAIKAEGTYAFGYDPEHGGGRLMTYHNGLWAPALDIERVVHRYLGEKVKRNRVKETIAALKAEVEHRPWNKWNIDRNLINCLSGMLNPKTFKLKRHKPDYYSTIQVPVEWNRNAKDTQLDQFMKQVLPEDCLGLVYMMIGYFLIPELSAKKMFLLVGPSDTGKTTFLSMIMSFFGQKNIALVSLQDLADNRFATAKLENKLLCIFDDMSDEALRNASTPKVLTGGVPIFSVERKGQDAYDAPLYARMLFCCNDMPVSRDKTSAWYKRLCLIPFQNEIPIEQQDRTLVKKLTTLQAKQALFRLAINGLHRLFDQGMHFSVPMSVAEELDKYKINNDSVVAFINEKCELGTDYKNERTQWYETYKNWCKQNGIHFLGRKTAYRRLQALVPLRVWKDSRGERFFNGIRLRSENFRSK